MMIITFKGATSVNNIYIKMEFKVEIPVNLTFKK